MRTHLNKLLSVLIAIIASLLLLPFGVVYVVITTFWKVFGATVIAFFVVGLFGGTMEECFKYSSVVAILVAVVIKLIEERKNLIE
jgi:hypothetical protein